MHIRDERLGLLLGRLELFPGAGHYPFDEDPERFARVLHDFIAGSQAAVYDEETTRRLLREGAAA